MFNFSKLFSWIATTARLKGKDNDAREKNPHIRESEFTRNLESEFNSCEDIDEFLEKYICFVSTQLIESAVKNNVDFKPEQIITLTQLRQFMKGHGFVFKK